MNRRRCSEPNSGSIWAAPIRSMAARAVAWTSQIEINGIVGGAAADHRGEGEQYRARHAVAAGCRATQRCRNGGKNLRRPGRKPAELRDGGVRRSTPRDEGRRAGRFHKTCSRQTWCAPAESYGKRRCGQGVPALDAVVDVRRAVSSNPTTSTIAMPWNRIFIAFRGINHVAACSGLSRPTFPTIFGA